MDEDPKTIAPVYPMTPEELDLWQAAIPDDVPGSALLPVQASTLRRILALLREADRLGWAGDRLAQMVRLYLDATRASGVHPDDLAGALRDYDRQRGR